MILVQVQVVTGPRVKKDGPFDMFVTVPDAVCPSFEAALRLFPHGSSATFQWGDVVVTGIVVSVHEQLALLAMTDV